MKTNKFLHYSGLWLSAVVAVTTMCIACDSDNDIEQNPSDPDQGKSEVTMTIKGNGATGTGTANDPIVVEKGNTYTMTVSQQSTYTDPNGSVTTREPKATMSLSAKLDTVVCKSLKDLTAMTTNAKTNDYGESPMQKNTIQTFNIGGQEITFDLAYEIYKIVNSQGKTIEMPYAKINNARYGKATTAETRAANVYATCIKLTQLPYIRGV